MGAGIYAHTLDIRMFSDGGPWGVKSEKPQVVNFSNKVLMRENRRKVEEGVRADQG